jgi:hypothetical protein
MQAACSSETSVESRGMYPRRCTCWVIERERSHLCEICASRFCERDCIAAVGIPPSGRALQPETSGQKSLQRATCCYVWFKGQVALSVSVIGAASVFRVKQGG